VPPFGATCWLWGAARNGAQRRVFCARLRTRSLPGQGPGMRSVMAGQSDAPISEVSIPRLNCGRSGTGRFREIGVRSSGVGQLPNTQVAGTLGQSTDQKAGGIESPERNSERPHEFLRA
jgi:hypothetical protein